MTNRQFKLVPVDYSRPYDEQPDCKRHVIGAYANLARHNMTVTINSIMLAIGMDSFNENEIDDAFNKKHRKKIAKIDNIQKVNLQKRLYRHFPFFKRMRLEDEAKKSVQLNTLLEVMDDFTSCMAMLRNFYTHYHPYNSPEEESNQRNLKKTMGRRLQYLYENTSQMFKSTESLDHESNEVVSALRIPEDYVQVIKPGDSDYNRTSNFYFNPTISEKKKRGIKYNPATKVFEKKAVRFVRNPKYQAYMMDDVEGMSDTAIIYFLCLFLEKKVAFELMDEAGFTEQIQFKGEHADRQLLYLKEIMCMNRIRMTKTKLDSEMSDTALALDMINELRKCPRPLYEVFSKEAREEFKDDTTVLWEQEHGKEAVVTEEQRDTDEETETLSAVKNTPRSTFVRWEDKFPQMALRYIDYQGLFKDIRFQLNLGKYRYAFYQHSKEYSVDNLERLRVLQKELHGFGRIQEVEQARKDKWSSLFEEKHIEDGLSKKEPDKAGQDPYITDQCAQYAIDRKSHSIGLRWEGWGEGDRGHGHYGDLQMSKIFLPYIPSHPERTDRQTNQAEPLLAPQAMFNLYELPGLLFYQYLLIKYNGSIADAENLIKTVHNNLIRFFTDVSKGILGPVEGANLYEREKNLSSALARYNLQVSDIPSKMYNFLVARDLNYDEKLYDSALQRLADKKKRVKKVLDSFYEKKRVIGTQKNRFDKLHATIQTGRLAAYLIRDIVDWLPSQSPARKRLSGQNYAALQAFLGLFGQQEGSLKTDELERVLQNAHLIPDESATLRKEDYHPFLKDVLSTMHEDTLESFFEDYFNREILHINKVEELIKSGDSFDDYYAIPFLHCDSARWMDPDAKMAARYLARPIQLPNGIFTKPIFELLWSINNSSLRDALKKSKNAGSDNQSLSNNIAYLIRLYFELVEEDHSQPFYDASHEPYRHVYRIFKKLYGKKSQLTNRTTSPAYTIDEIRSLRKKAAEDIKAYVEEEMKPQQYKFEHKLRKKLQKENDRRYKNREKQLNIEAEVKKAVEQEIDPLKLDMTSKLERQLKIVYENERGIRRYKTQDILLLIMAREILKAKSPDQDFTKGFNLKYVMEDSLLDKPIDFTWNVVIRDKEKGATKKGIEQKNMKMKNYGQFYKFASDHQRLESLLSRLPQSVFQRAEIENEISYYDTNRSEVFRQVYIIESEAYKLKPGLGDDKNANETWFNYIDKKTGKPRPIRNSFIRLLEILAAGEDGIISESEKATLQKTRNAFGHNTYDVDLQTIFEGKESKMKIPEVANGIKGKIEEQTEELKKRID